MRSLFTIYVHSNEALLILRVLRENSRCLFAKQALGAAAAASDKRRAASDLLFRYRHCFGDSLEAHKVTSERAGHGVDCLRCKSSWDRENLLPLSVLVNGRCLNEQTKLEHFIGKNPLAFPQLTGWIFSNLRYEL